MKKEEIKTESTQPPSAGFQLVETSMGSPKVQLLPGGLNRPIINKPEGRMQKEGIQAGTTIGDVSLTKLQEPLINQMV